MYTCSLSFSRVWWTPLLPLHPPDDAAVPMGGSRPMVPPPSISMLGTPKATGDMLTMKRPNSNRVGGIRSITPPRSIAQTPAKGLGVQNTTFEGFSIEKVEQIAKEEPVIPTPK